MTITLYSDLVILSHNTAVSAGVGILFSKAFTPLSLKIEHVIEGWCLLVEAGFDKFTVVFINVYAPNNGSERKLILETLSVKYKTIGHLIICF